jgi:hypothetical protein
MARTLTTPVEQPDALQQAVSTFTVVVPHIADIGGSMIISRAQVQLQYEVITYDADGTILYRTNRTVLASEWPVNFVQDMKEIYARIEADAENAGIILGPGTDEPLE